MTRAFPIVFNRLAVPTYQTREEAVASMSAFVSRLIAGALDIGADGLWREKHFLEILLSPGYTIGDWLLDVGVSRDLRLLLRRFLDRGRLIEELIAENVAGSFDVLRAVARYAGSDARSLLVAALEHGVATGLAPVGPWRDGPIDIEISVLDREELGHFTVCAIVVSSCSQIKSAIAARTVGVADVRRYRRMISPLTGRHMPASEYRKHVRGRTDEARRAAVIAHGDGQFIILDEDHPLDDHRIRTIEREALVAGWRSDPSAKVIDKGNTFHILYDVRRPIGFALQRDAAIQTRVIRVEWSSGHVHSHPRHPNA